MTRKNTSLIILHRAQNSPSLLFLFIFVTRITPTKDCTDINWELVTRNIQKASNPKNATVPDLVSSRDLFFVSSELDTYSLLPLCKNSLTSASFPDNWKLPRATPVFEKGKSCDVNDYRSIQKKIVQRLELTLYTRDTLHNRNGVLFFFQAHQ